MAHHPLSKSTPVRRGRRRGFLPIETNAFDRVFISIVLYVAIHLVWMRLIEGFLPLWIATVLALGLTAVILWKG
jgi:predicted small integral membrane protein